MARAPEPSQRRRRWLFGGAAVLGLLVAAYAGVVRWEAWSKHHNEQQAEAAFLEHDFQRTRLLLEQAVQVNPRDLDARRQLAEFYERADPTLALARWREAVVLEPERDEARFGLAGCALRLGEQAAAREALAGVSAPGRELIEYQRLAAGLALLTDDRAGLEHALARVAQLDPGDVRARFNLAALQFTSAAAPVAAAGRAVLVELARSGPLTIRATVELMRAGRRAPSAEPEWDRLAHEVAPELADSHVGRLALARHAQAQPAPVAGDAAVLVAWLGELGLAREVLAWLDGLDPAVRTAPAVMTAHADLAARAHDWRRLQPLVQDSAWGHVTADVVTLAFAARAQHEGPGSVHARATWDDALDLATAQLSALHVLVRLAEAWTWSDATKAALWRVARNFPAEASAWRALAAGAEAEGDSAEAWEVAQSWARARPAEPAAQAHAQWLGVVLGGKVDAELQAAALAALAQPAAPPESLAAGALLLLGAGNPAGALAALKPHEAALATSPRAALAYGYVLAVAGPPGEAARWLDLAAAVKLLPKERALLDRARAGTGPNAGRGPAAAPPPATRP